jgi:hypothetical protein
MSAESGAPREISTLPQRQPVPRFRAPATGSCIRLRGRPTVLGVAAARLFALYAVAGSHSPGVRQLARAGGLSIRDVQTRINVEMAFQLRDSGTSVRAVKCVCDSSTHARCGGEMPGDGPATLKIDVRIDPDSGIYRWPAVGRTRSSARSVGPFRRSAIVAVHAAARVRG